MSPQLVDMNADGMNDMVMATFEGTAFWVEGSKDGFIKPQHIVDCNNENIRISMYWDDEEEDYLFVDRSAENEDYFKQHHLTSTAAVDWDEDGDLDLLLGAYEGALYLCLNQGSKEEPIFAATNLQVKSDGKLLTIQGGLATPRVCDWNRDGLFDILCGGSSGGVFFYANIGQKGKPEFAAAQTLVQQSLEDSYASGLVPTKNGLPMRPDSSFHIDALDYDHDGDLDLLVGAKSYYAISETRLSNDEQEELQKLEQELNQLTEELTEFFNEANGELKAMEKLYESDDFSKFQSKLGQLMIERESLSPATHEANLVWLYRNKGDNRQLVEASNSTQSRANSEFALDAINDAFSDRGADSDNELTVSAKFLPPEVETVVLAVQIEIPAGHHIYGSKNAIEPTQFSISESGCLELPELAKAPRGRIRMSSGKRAYWLEDTVTIEQTFSIPADFVSATVEGHIHFMMCDEETCDPPKKVKFSATLDGK